MIRAQEVFNSAAAVWRMDGSGDVEASGAAAVGVALTGDARAASLARGGDGLVARLEGGCLFLGCRTPIDWSGREALTLCIRLRADGARWEGAILARADPADNLGVLLRGAAVDRAVLNPPATRRLRGGSAIEFVWRSGPLPGAVTPDFLETEWCRALRRISGADFDDGILRLGAPADLIGAGDWHDLVLRFRRGHLACFADGVLVDEEWPPGNVERFATPLLLGAAYEAGALVPGFRGWVDHAAVWDRALDDDEIAALSGGAAAAAEAERAFYGPPPARMQYWLPPGFNTFVGDCMPFYHDGVFHLYYLFDRRRHKSKWGMGAHQFAHMSTRDLVHWEHHALALPVSEPWECSIGTGSLVARDGAVRAFYIHHGKRGYYRDAPTRGETIHEAVSADGVHFAKRPDPVLPLDYREFDDVNPDLFPSAAGTGWHLSVSGWKVFDSPDLKTWTENRAFESPRDLPRWICCSIFVWNGWHYYAGCGYYRVSRDPVAPGWRWREPAHPATRDGLGVPKIAAFKDNRFLLAGFLGPVFGGELVFRELVQHADGTLGTKFPPEMTPPCGAPRAAAFVDADGADAVTDDGTLRLDGGVQSACARLDDPPAAFRLTARVAPEAGVVALGFAFRGVPGAPNGFALRIEPAAGRVSFVAYADGRPAGEPVRVIEGVAGLGQPFDLDLFALPGLIDVCLDGWRTIIARVPETCVGGRLFLFAEGGRAGVDRLTLCEVTT